MNRPWWQFWRQDSSAQTVATPAPKVHRDGWSNVLTGLGITGKDKRLGAIFASSPMHYQECRELWRGNDLAATIVERVPDDMLRQGFDIKLGDQAEQLGPKVKTKLNTLGLIPALRKALYYQRAYGGGVVWMGVDDGQTDLTKPLNEKAIRSFNWVEVYTPQEMQAATWNRDSNSPNFGNPETYRANNGGKLVEIHYSRLLVFSGPVLDRQHRQERQGFGDSIFVRVNSVLSDFGQSFESVPLLIADFSQSVYKLENLANLIAGNQEGLVVNRIQVMELMRSILRGIVIDKNEEWNRHSTTVAGLGELLDKLTFRLSAAAKIPVTLLFGQAPAGLNATGDSDIRNYYDGVASKQEDDLRPPLERGVRLIFLSKDGPTAGKEPQMWSVGFRPLWQLTAVQQAELQNKQASTDKIYIETGVATKEEIALSRFGGDEYSIETNIDVAARKNPPKQNGAPA